MLQPCPGFPSLRGASGLGAREQQGRCACTCGDARAACSPRLVTLQLTLVAKSPPSLGARSSPSPPHPATSGMSFFLLAADPLFCVGVGGCRWKRKSPRLELGKQRPSLISTGKGREQGEAALLCLADPPPFSFWALSKSACFNLSVCLTGEMDWKTQGRSKQLSPWGKLSAHNSLGLV